MARINIEDELSFDPRFQAVIQTLGNADTAVGMAYRLFRLAQRYWGDDRKFIPNEIYDMHGLDIFLTVGLARRCDDGVYVCGTRDHLEWYAERKDAARAGGLKSAESRKQKTGTSIPSGGSNNPNKTRRSKTEPNASKPNPLALTPPLSLSLALSPVSTADAAKTKKRSRAIHRHATHIIAALRVIDDDEKARSMCHPTIWNVLKTLYPRNTWSNLRTSLKQHIDRKAESYFRNDIAKHLDSFLPESGEWLTATERVATN